MITLSSLLNAAPAALVILNGDNPNGNLLSHLWQKCQQKIATDGALNFLNTQRLSPDLVIGDMDSVADELLAKSVATDFIKLPDQETTDSEKALNYLLQDDKWSAIHLCPLQGDRLDHILYNLRLLRNLINRVNAFAWTNKELIFFTDNPVVVDNCKGQRISFCSAPGSSLMIKTKGLLYELDTASLAKKINFSISNRINSDRLLLDIKSGQIQVIIEHKLGDARK